jgi:hypothetical protein
VVELGSFNPRIFKRIEMLDDGGRSLLHDMVLYESAGTLSKAA